MIFSILLAHWFKQFKVQVASWIGNLMVQLGCLDHRVRERLFQCFDAIMFRRTIVAARPPHPREQTLAVVS
jgi:hypothetical protein